MPTLRTTKIHDDILSVMRTSLTYHSAGVEITAQLDRKVYVKVNEVLTNFGGKWDRRQRLHLFDAESLTHLQSAINEGNYVDQKKTYQFYETPPAVVDLMLDLAPITAESMILEPSAGHGAIALCAAERAKLVTCIELDPAKVSVLNRHGFPTVEADFLTVQPPPLFDVILMNPPFSNLQDIAHVRHAYDFLRPGGMLLAITSPSWTFNIAARAVEFSEWFFDVNGLHNELPDGSFKESGTNVKTLLLTIEKE